jgi:hypothetical protein
MADVDGMRTGELCIHCGCQLPEGTPAGERITLAGKTIGEARLCTRCTEDRAKLRQLAELERLPTSRPH